MSSYEEKYNHFCVGFATCDSTPEGDIPLFVLFKQKSPVVAKKAMFDSLSLSKHRHVSQLQLKTNTEPNITVSVLMEIY